MKDENQTTNNIYRWLDERLKRIEESINSLSIDVKDNYVKQAEFKVFCSYVEANTKARNWTVGIVMGGVVASLLALVLK